MRVMLRFGRGELPVDLPADADVTMVEKAGLTPLADPAAAIVAELAAPPAGAPLAELARGRERACVLICDRTRPVPNAVILPPLIRALAAGGIPAERVTVLVATGLHAPPDAAERRLLVGDDPALAGVIVASHDARDDDAHADLGATACGTRVRLDRRFVDADLRLVVGLVEPHFMAGYSGGRKLVTPGVAHAETITRIHSHAFLGQPEATTGVLDGNPLHEELTAIADGLAPIYAVHTVLDEQQAPCSFHFGEVTASHAAAVRFFRASGEVALPRRFRTVITSAAGYPLDATYYQTVKAAVGVLGVAAPGARVFIAAACDEGFGSPEFAQAQDRLVTLGPDAFLAEVRARRHALIDEWQTVMLLRATATCGVTLFTEGLAEAERRLTAVDLTTSLGEAVRDWLDTGDDRAVAVVPEGPYVLPRAY